MIPPILLAMPLLVRFGEFGLRVTLPLVKGVIALPRRKKPSLCF